MNCEHHFANQCVVTHSVIVERRTGHDWLSILVNSNHLCLRNNSTFTKRLNRPEGCYRIHLCYIHGMQHDPRLPLPLIQPTTQSLLDILLHRAIMFDSSENRCVRLEDVTEYSSSFGAYTLGHLHIHQCRFPEILEIGHQYLIIRQLCSVGGCCDSIITGVTCIVSGDRGVL